MSEADAQQRWRETCQLFHELSDLGTVERLKRLIQIGATDPELRDAVEALLAGDDAADERLAPLKHGITDVLHRNLLAPRPPAADPLRLVGQTLSHFRIIEPLAAGGMGVVYRAEDTRLQRDVALKLPLAALQDDARGRARFLREAHAAGALDHPNLCSVYEVGESEHGHPFLAMALYAGETLKSRIAHAGPLPLAEALDVARQVALGLAFAHGAGVVHRDLKPGNIMLLPDGTAKILDFGLAKLSELSHTASGAGLGTAGYMAPEQIRGKAVDMRADLWSLGVVLYEMLTGTRPFSGDDIVSMSHAILNAEAPRPSVLRSPLPRAVDELVSALLQKDPAQRYASAADVTSDLAAIQRGAQPAFRRNAPARALSWLRVRVRPLKAASAASMLAFTAFTLLTLLAGWTIASREKPARPQLDANLIVVLPFRAISTDKDFAVIGDGIVDLLATKLGGTIGPRAVDPHTTFAALRQWHKSTNELSRDSALLLAGSLGAGRMLSGSVVVTLRRIRINADLIDVAGGRVRGRATVEGDVDSLTTLLDQLTSQVIGAELGESTERLATFTSTSPESVHEYLRGRDALRRLRFDQAVGHFDRALQLDSLFALAAHYYVRAATYWPASYPGWERANRLACAAKDRVNPSEKLRLIAFSACPDVITGNRDGFNPKLLAFLESAAATAPGDADLWAKLGDYLFHFGAGLPNGRARATTALERALELDVPYLEALPHLVVLKAADGDTAAVRRLGNRLAREDSTGFWAAEGIWLPAIVLGDTAVVHRLRRSRFAELMTNPGSLQMVITLSQNIGIGDEDAALAVQTLKARADSMGTVTARGIALAHTGRYALNAGRPSQALTVNRYSFDGVLRTDLADILHVLQALFWDGDRTTAEIKVQELIAFTGTASGQDTIVDGYIKPYAHCALGLWFLSNHDTLRAKAHVALTPAFSNDTPKLHGYCKQTLNTMLAFARAAPDRNVQLERLDSLFQIYAGFYGNGSYVSRSSRLVAARLFERSGLPERALAAVRHVEPYGPNAKVMLTSMLREEGRLAALTGDTASAIRAYRHYLALRHDPEPPLRPEVERIRRELAQLERATRSRLRGS